MTFTNYPGPTNSIKLVQFDISIANSFAADSFIDHMSAFSYDPKPATLARSKEIIKGNMRYDRIISNISEYATPVSIEHLNSGGADETDDGTAFSFCVTFDRIHTIYTYDEANGSLIVDPIAALKRQIARALTATIGENRQIFDPTEIDGAARNSDRQDWVVAAPLTGSLATAAAAVTITKHHN